MDDDEKGDQLRQQIELLRLARADMDDTQAAVVALQAELGEGTVPDNILMRALKTAIAVSYGRSFTDGKGGWLSRAAWAPSGFLLHGAHEMLCSRCDELSSRTLDPYPSAVRPQEPPEGWPRDRPDDWTIIIQLCEEQRHRFEATTIQLEEELRQLELPRRAPPG